MTRVHLSCPAGGMSCQGLTSLLGRADPKGPKRLILADPELVGPVGGAWGAGLGRATEALRISGIVVCPFPVPLASSLFTALDSEAGVTVTLVTPHEVRRS